LVFVLLESSCWGKLGSQGEVRIAKEEADLAAMSGVERPDEGVILPEAGYK
jgi:hypothetical protein